MLLRDATLVKGGSSGGRGNWEFSPPNLSSTYHQKPKIVAKKSKKFLDMCIFKIRNE